MRHLDDGDLADEISEIRTYLAERLPAGDHLGRRMATVRLVALEDEMVRRYEAEVFGAER